MQGEEKKELARTIFETVAAELAKEKYCDVGTDAEGVPKLTYYIVDSREIAFALTLYPVGLVEQVIADAEVAAEKALSDLVAKVTNEDERKYAKAVKDTCYDMYVKTLADTATRIYLHDLPVVLADEVDRAGRVALHAAGDVVRRYLTRLFEERDWPLRLSRDQQEEKALLRTIVAERREWIRAYQGGDNQWVGAENFAENYQILLPIWQDAKKIYGEHGAHATWCGMVRAKYPEINFHDDLLYRLTGKLCDLPEEVQAKVSDSGGDNTPSSIALEHAARMCGARAYQYSTRYLYELRRKNKSTEQIDAG